MAAVALLSGCERKPAADAGGIVRPLAPAASAFFQVLEAEAAGANGNFAPAAADGAAGEAALAIAAGAAAHGKLKGSARFTFTAPAAATVQLWLRVRWTGSCSNSVIVKVPGQPPRITGESATYNTWHWVEGPRFSVQPGPVEVELQAREDGIFVDQLILSADLVRVPVGIEKPATAASATAPPTTTPLAP